MTAGDGQAAELAPVADNEILDFLSAPMRFEAGHQLRSTRCVGCGTMIGGQPFTIHQTVGMNTPACRCGGLSGTIFLACTDCAMRPAEDLTALAVVRAAAHHGGPR